MTVARPNSPPYSRHVVFFHISFSKQESLCFSVRERQTERGRERKRNREFTTEPIGKKMKQMTGKDSLPALECIVSVSGLKSDAELKIS